MKYGFQLLILSIFCLVIQVYNSNLKKESQNHNNPTTHQPVLASELLKNYRPMGHQKVGLWDDFNSLSYKYQPNYVSIILLII